MAEWMDLQMKLNEVQSSINKLDGIANLIQFAFIVYLLWRTRRPSPPDEPA